MTLQHFISLAIRRDRSIAGNQRWWNHSCPTGVVEHHSDGRYVSSGMCATGETIFYRVPDDVQ
jgi:hypothetical protein